MNVFNRYANSNTTSNTAVNFEQVNREIVGLAKDINRTFNVVASLESIYESLNTKLETGTSLDDTHVSLLSLNLNILGGDNTSTSLVCPSLESDNYFERTDIVASMEGVGASIMAGIKAAIKAVMDWFEKMYQRLTGRHAKVKKQTEILDTAVKQNKVAEVNPPTKDETYKIVLEGLPQFLVLPSGLVVETKASGDKEGRYHVSTYDNLIKKYAEYTQLIPAITKYVKSVELMVIAMAFSLNREDADEHVKTIQSQIDEIDKYDNKDDSPYLISNLSADQNTNALKVMVDYNKALLSADLLTKVDTLNKVLTNFKKEVDKSNTASMQLISAARKVLRHCDYIVTGMYLPASIHLNGKYVAPEEYNK